MSTDLAQLVRELHESDLEGHREQVDTLIGLIYDLRAEHHALRTGIANAMAILDGHTCHAGHTDTDHLQMHRQVVAEVRALLARTA